MVQKLSKTDENRLLNTLQKVADYTNDGETPNDAIVKAASEMKIPHGQIQLLVNAFNTGRTTVQRNSSDDVWEKASDFPLASTDDILERLYPDQNKTANDQHRDTIVSTEYRLPPSWASLRTEAEKKASNLVTPVPAKHPDPYPKLQNDYAKARTEIKKASFVVEESMRRAWHVRDLAQNAKNELTEYFKTASCVPFQEVRKNAELMYGEPAKVLFDSLAAEVPSFSKQASTGRLARAVGQPYDLTHQCLDYAKAYELLRADYEEKLAESKTAEDDLMRPFDQPTKSVSRLGLPVSVLVGGHEDGSVSKQAAPSAPGGASDLDLATALGKAIKGKPTHPFLQGAKAVSGLGIFNPKEPGRSLMSRTFGESSPAGHFLGPIGQAHQDKILDAFGYSPVSAEPDLEHESAMDTLQQQSTLSDLLSSDPVLMHRDPHEVLRAYAALRSMAPLAMNNKELLRTMLRKHVEAGQSDLFESEVLTKIEKNLSQLQRGKSRGDDDDGN